MIVLADRYVYTAFARDTVRGCDREWVRKVYSFAPKPDIAYYFRVPIEVAVKRLTQSRQVLKDFEAGMDLNLHHDSIESFRIFQGRILDEYDRMSDAHDFTVIDATANIADQQRIVRTVASKKLANYSRKPRIA
jgi:dTMP kinase